MERREFLRASSSAVLASIMTAGASAAQVASSPSARPSPSPRTRAGAVAPNIIILITDQTRAGLTKKSGFPLDTMPTADALAARGMDFARAYCTVPACVPSRISMLTGRWPQAHRVRMNLDAKDAYFAQDIYQVARAQDYRTGLCGKNHTYLAAPDVDVFHDYSHEGGPKEANTSHEIGPFEQWLKGLDFNLALEPAPFPLETQLPYRIVSDAIDFMRTDAAVPFCCRCRSPSPTIPNRYPIPIGTCFRRTNCPTGRPGRTRFRISAIGRSGWTGSRRTAFRTPKSNGGATYRTIWARCE